MISPAMHVGRDEVVYNSFKNKEDHFVFFSGARWADYERLLEIRGDRRSPRISYLDGELEIMTKSGRHEEIKSWIAGLLEVYCLDHDILFGPIGETTINDERKQAGAEPDEGYMFGPRRRRAKQPPHLVIEVVWTSGGIDKLEMWARLGVREVWFWKKGRLQVFRLRGERYRAIPRSLFVPDLDLDVLLQFIDRPTMNEAVREFRATLAGRGKK
jgi:Uma2 family endonuclease